MGGVITSYGIPEKRPLASRFCGKMGLNISLKNGFTSILVAPSEEKIRPVAPRSSLSFEEGVSRRAVAAGATVWRQCGGGVTAVCDSVVTVYKGGNGGKLGQCLANEVCPHPPNPLLPVESRYHIDEDT